MPNYLKGKVIIVTGAAAGFGEILSRKISAMGAKIVAADIDQKGLGKVTKLVREQGGEIIGVATDVTDKDQMRHLADKALGEFNAIDVLINNAGIMPLAFYSDHQKAEDSWERCIDINIKGVLNGIVAVHDQMIKQGGGHIVNLASIYGNYPTAGGGVYGATKAAVIFLSESLRIESQGKIKVTIVRPTGVPATKLGAGIINPAAVTGLLGQNTASYMSKFEAAEAGQLPPSMTDINHIEYFALDPESLVDQIIYAINQPEGVAISDITVRASGDGYVI
ncbi:MAG: SDR family oxidoreductase [Pseudomonadota bacterium]|nr:short-chain dehydrogenase [Gammaproteobacteria bacterium]MEC8645322.1 SDR family oxidoreductase [Pseudomonadota bacterium]